MEEHSDKVDPTTVEAIELAIANLEEQMETEDAGKIKSGIQNVTEAAMKLGEAIYKADRRKPVRPLLKVPTNLKAWTTTSLTPTSRTSTTTTSAPAKGLDDMRGPA